MILREIYLQNFRKYSDAHVLFSEGIVGVLGPNGAGKSTLFEAVAWALFGNEMSRTGGFGLVTSGLNADSCKVELVFEKDGVQYRVCRSLTFAGKFTHAKIYKSEKQVVFGSKATGKYINELIGMDPKVFLRTIYCRQGELALLSKESPTLRQALIERVTGLDWLDRATNMVRRDRKQAQREIHESYDPKHLAELEFNASAASKSLENLDSELQYLQCQLKEGERKYEKYRLIKVKIELLEKEKDRISKKLENLVTSLISNVGLSSEKLTEELNNTRLHIRETESELARIDNLIKALAGAHANCSLCGAVIDKKSRLTELLTNRTFLKSKHKECVESERILRGQLKTVLLNENNTGESIRRRQELVRKLEEIVRSVDTFRSSLAFDVSAYEKLKCKSDELTRARQKSAIEEALFKIRLEEAKKHQHSKLAVDTEALRTLEGLLVDVRVFLLRYFLTALERESSILLDLATDGALKRFSSIEILSSR